MTSAGQTATLASLPSFTGGRAGVADRARCG